MFEKNSGQGGNLPDSPTPCSCNYSLDHLPVVRGLTGEPSQTGGRLLFSQIFCRNLSPSNLREDKIMTYPNEHSCRLLSPEAAIQCRRTKRFSDGKEYHIITCEYRAPPKGKSHWAEQAYRYPIAVWSEESASAHCKRHQGRFEPAQPEETRKYTLEDIPGRLVKRRQIIKSEDGSATFIKIEPDYPIIQGGIEKRELKDFEYLLHSGLIEPEGEKFDHCLVYDHLANMFEIDHVEGKDGKIYHAIIGLEPTQSVTWSDEEAKEARIEPKEMKPGMSFEEKSKEW